MSLTDWRTSGMTLDEYKTFVRFADPLQAAEVLCAAMAERDSLASGGSGGYIPGYASGMYEYPASAQFNVSKYTALAHCMDRFHILAVKNGRSLIHCWIPTGDFISGGTMRCWNDNFSSLLTSVGLGDFSVASAAGSYSIPRFTLANQADYFISIASGLALLTHADGSRRYGYDDFATLYTEYTSGNGFPWSETTTIESHNLVATEVWSAYQNSSRTVARGYVEWPTSVTMSHMGGSATANVSITFSGEVFISSAGDTGYHSGLECPVVATLQPGAVVTSAIPGARYNVGMTLRDLLPSAGYSVSGSATGSAGYGPYAGHRYTISGMVLSTWVINDISSAVKFFS